MTKIQERMKRLGVKQVDLIRELQAQGVIVQVPEMSQIVSGLNTCPKAKRVLMLCEEILEKKESS